MTNDHPEEKPTETPILPREEREKAIAELTDRLEDLLMQRLVMETMRLNPHGAIWMDGPDDEGDFLLCLLQHDHGGSDKEAGPDCLLWRSVTPHVRVDWAEKVGLGVSDDAVTPTA